MTGHTPSEDDNAEKRPHRVFVSHSSADKKFVRRLVEDLDKHDLNVWFDQKSLKVGDSIVNHISAILEETDYFVVVLSRESVKSKWVGAELNAALMDRLSSRGPEVLPVLIEECDPPKLLTDIVWADFTSDYATGLAMLLEVFGEEAESTGQFIPNLTDAAIGKSTLASLTVAQLRRRLRTLQRSVIADIWNDTLGTLMDGDQAGSMRDRDRAYCVRVLMHRTREKDRTNQLLSSLLDNAPELVESRDDAPVPAPDLRSTSLSDSQDEEPGPDAQKTAVVYPDVRHNWIAAVLLSIGDGFKHVFGQLEGTPALPGFAAFIISLLMAMIPVVLIPFCGENGFLAGCLLTVAIFLLFAGGVAMAVLSYFSFRHKQQSREPLKVQMERIAQHNWFSEQHLLHTDDVAVVVQLSPNEYKSRWSDLMTSLTHRSGSL